MRATPSGFLLVGRVLSEVRPDGTGWNAFTALVGHEWRANDPEYIVRLISQVIYVSLETVKIVKTLPSLGVSQATAVAVQ